MNGFGTLRCWAVLAACLLTGAPASTAAPASRSGTVRLDGIAVYYEVHGEGKLNGGAIPVVLLGGGALTIDLAFSRELVTRFAQTRPVILIEQQGHGHTADRPDAPMRIEQMVKDTAGVLNQIGARQVDLFGVSLGGIVATGVAIRHPQLVRNLTTLGTPFRLEGFLPELVRIQRDPTLTPSPELAALFPTETDFANMRASFRRVAPTPDAFDAILGRLNAMLAAWPGWTEAELRGIRARMLIAIGDNDYVRIEHATEVAHMIPSARLAVLPGTTHLGIVKRDAWLAPMIDSLAQPPL